MRRHPRVTGPFEGRRVGLLTVPVRIHDLSLGGCLIEALHEQRPGQAFTLEIELPDRSWVRVEAESLYTRPDYGFAARFISMSDDVRATLEAFVRRTLATAPSKSDAP